jgi:hypothetical protein
MRLGFGRLPAQLIQGRVKFAPGRQGDRATCAAFEADLATREATKRMSHDRQAGFDVPFKYVVGTEVETSKIGAARVRVQGRKPRDLFAKTVYQGLSILVQLSHE